TGEERLLPPAETPAEPPAAHKPAGMAPVSSEDGHTASSVESDLTMPAVVVPPEEPPPARPSISVGAPVSVPHAAVSLAPAVTPVVQPPVAATPSARQPVGQSERRPVSVKGLIAKAEPAPGTRMQQKGVTVKIATAVASPPPSPTATKAAAPPSRPAIGGARLQLGSFKNREDAEKAWSQLAIRHSDLLGGASHVVVQVDLGEKGIWHRIYAGPYGDVQAALSTCEALRQRSVGCIFARK
ncbi:MAG: hypothetical protein FD153_657, partial [Rhodospirillaceae bacterium]